MSKKGKSFFRKNDKRDFFKAKKVKNIAVFISASLFLE
jgi:hypothetical protein